MKKILFLISFIVLIFGCTQKSFEKKISQNFYLKKIDLNGLQFIAKLNDTILKNGIAEIIIPDYVFAYGSNENVIIAKSHPSGYPEMWSVDTTKTYFYVIDLNHKNDTLYGPLKEYQFENKLYELNGSLIEFDNIFPETIK